MKDSLLFLVHRCPYPPNKGDKIRSYHILRYLSKYFDIHLGAFVDDPTDRIYEKELRNLCASVCLCELTPSTARRRSLKGLWQGVPLTLPYYQDRKLREWISVTVQKHRIRYILVFSSGMAQYAEAIDADNVVKMIDFVDVDSEKWNQYATERSGPSAWIYRREGKKLLQYERRVATQFDASIFVSEQELALFQRLAPESTSHLTWIGNGVDTEFFSPGRDYVNPYDVRDKVIVFTGAMDYWPNVDAVTWFVKEVFGLVRNSEPTSKFVIVGARPAKKVRDLSQVDGVTVTRAVTDIRPYLNHASVVVAPLRIARGIQNKVLEGLAMAKPLVASSEAMVGIELGDNIMDLEANEPSLFGQKIIRYLRRGDIQGTGQRCREVILRRYSWEERLKPLKILLSEAGQRKGSMLGRVGDVQAKHKTPAAEMNLKTHSI